MPHEPIEATPVSRRFPAETIKQHVWLYLHVPLGYQDTEEMIAERGIILTYETLGNRLKRLGGTCAKRLRSRSTQPSVRRHPEEIFSINQ
jgi:putative transposase